MTGHARAGTPVAFSPLARDGHASRETRGAREPPLSLAHDAPDSSGELCAIRTLLLLVAFRCCRVRPTNSWNRSAEIGQ